MTSDRRPRIARRAATALGIVFIIASAPPPAGAQTPDKTAETPPPVERLALPGRDWALDLSLPGFVNILDSYSKESNERTLMAGPVVRKNLHSLMIRMMPAQGGGGADEYRAHLIASSKKLGNTSSLRSYEYGGLPLLRHKFDILAAMGGPPSMAGFGAGPNMLHSLTAFLARDGVWVSITLWGVSKSIGGQDEKAFYAILDTVRFVDTSAPSSSFDFFHKGRGFYKTGEYSKAAEFYGRALELERRERRLDAATWRRLVEEASRAYGLTGDLGRARATAEYGLSQDPDYPLFHLLMAIIHASRDDLDATVAALRKAFANKAALPLAARLPDPRTYAPFRHFAKDERFRKATKDMKP